MPLLALSGAPDQRVLDLRVETSPCRTLLWSAYEPHIGTGRREPAPVARLAQPIFGFPASTRPTFLNSDDRLTSRRSP